MVLCLYRPQDSGQETRKTVPNPPSPILTPLLSICSRRQLLKKSPFKSLHKRRLAAFEWKESSANLNDGRKGLSAEELFVLPAALLSVFLKKDPTSKNSRILNKTLACEELYSDIDSIDRGEENSPEAQHE